VTGHGQSEYQHYIDLSDLIADHNGQPALE